MNVLFACAYAKVFETTEDMWNLKLRKRKAVILGSSQKPSFQETVELASVHSPYFTCVMENLKYNGNGDF